MDKLYVACLIEKKNVVEMDSYICKVIGVVVGLKFGNRLLSSNSHHYLPMINVLFSDNMIDLNYDYSNDKFLNNNEALCYYNLKEITDYSKLDDVVSFYKSYYKDVCYYINLSEGYMMRYKS